MYKLDKKDHQILFELDRNSRQSINELAKKTKLSRDVVAYRIKQLEKEGILEDYIAIIDFTKLGFQIVRLYIKLQNTAEEIEKEMINFLIDNEQTLTVYKIDGYYDLAVGFLARHLTEYQVFYEDFLKKYKMFVIEKNFSVFRDYLHYHRNYLVEKKKRDYSIISTGSFKKFNYDPKDIQLLKMISIRARISLLELAKKLNMTPTGVKYKLKNLEKEKVIVAYKIRINFNKLGYQYYKIDLQLEDINIIPSLNQFVIQHSNVIYQDIAIGGSDFEFDCELKSQEDFYKLINEIKNLFPQKIRSYFYYKAIKIYKYVYMPEIEFYSFTKQTSAWGTPSTNKTFSLFTKPKSTKNFTTFFPVKCKI